MKRICTIVDSTNFFNSIISTNNTVDVISCYHDFSKSIFSRYDIIFILAELKWQTKKRTDFFGLELVKQLRTIHKVTCPIVVCSFLQVFKKHEFFKAPGHYLIQLPLSLSSLDQYEGIDDELLNDINIHLFDSEGVFHTMMHDLENKLASLSQTFQDKKVLVQYLNEILDKKFMDAENVIEAEKRTEYNRIKECIKTELENEILNNPDYLTNNNIRNLIGEKYKSLLYNLLPIKLTDSQQQDFKQKRWQVLFIDDVEAECMNVRNKFLQRGITCLTATTGEDAIKILKEDISKRNRIAMVISDFRLYENGDENCKWQTMQGYQLLKHIHMNEEFPHFAYAVLTSKKGTILDKIKQKSNFPVLWFYKSDVLLNDATFNLFYQRICEVASESFLKKQNLPKATIWKKGNKDRINPGLSFYYKLHLESIDYEECVTEMNKRALENIQHVRENGIEAGLKENISYQISLRLTENNDNSENIEKFRESILLCRRIYWGLNFFLGLTPKDIYHIFTIESLSKDEEGMLKALFNTTWGISTFDDFTKSDSSIKQFGILREEFEFLQSYKGSYEVNDNDLDLINDIEFLKDFFDSLKDELPTIREVSTISDKLIANQVVKQTEFERCLRKIKEPSNQNKLRKLYESFLIEIDDINSDYLKSLIRGLVNE